MLAKREHGQTRMSCPARSFDRPVDRRALRVGHERAERFVHGTPQPAPLPEAVWIYPPATVHNMRNESVNSGRRCFKVALIRLRMMEKLGIGRQICFRCHACRLVLSDRNRERPTHMAAAPRPHKPGIGRQVIQARRHRLPVVAVKSHGRPCCPGI